MFVQAGSRVQISEVFESFQGEGPLAGTPSVFVRTSGCNLRCWFCDTPYTSWYPEGDSRLWEDVVREVAAFDVEHVVVTGGEPLMQDEVVPLSESLKELGLHVTFETAGTVFLPVAADLMVVSPKMANSTPDATDWSERHNRVRNNPETIRRLLDQFECVFKFVVESRADVEDIIAWCSQFPRVTSSQVWLMPQATTAEQLHEKLWLPGVAKEHGFRFTSRLHIEQYGNARGR